MNFYMLIVAMFFSLAKTTPPSGANDNCDCKTPIYYFDISQTFEAPCKLPDTIAWEEAGMRYELIITECGGAGSFTQTDMPKNKIVYSAKYKSPEKMTVDSIYTYNEDTFKESLEVVSQYRPERTEVNY